MAGGIIPYSDGVVVTAAKEGTGMRAQMWSKVPVVCNIFMPDSVLAGGDNCPLLIGGYPQHNMYLNKASPEEDGISSGGAFMCF